jgi:hypothetical protein
MQTDQRHSPKNWWPGPAILAVAFMVACALGWKFAKPGAVTSSGPITARHAVASTPSSSASAALQHKARRPRKSSDLELAIRRAMAESDPAKRSHLWHELAIDSVRAGHDSIRRVLTLAWKISEPDLRNEFCQALYAEWAQTDAPGVMEALKELGDAEQQLAGTLAIMRGWIGRDLEGSLQWVSQQPPEASLTREMNRMLTFTLQQQSPQAVMAMLEASGSAILPREFYASFLGRPEENDPSVAAKSLLQSGSEPIQAVLGDHIVGQWAQQSPLDAASFAASMPPGESQDRATIWVIEGWSFVEPEKAAQWVEKFGETPLREQAVERVISAWVKQNVEASAAWLQSLPASRSRDIAVGIFCDRITFIDRDAAMLWGQTIQDRALRLSVLDAVGSAFDSQQ